MWKEIAKDWEKIPPDTYKFLFSQAKERYDEIISESESMTNKAVSLTTISIAALTAFVGYNFKVKPEACSVTILGALYLLNIIVLAKLLFPKNIIMKGSPPNEIFNDYLDNPQYLPEDKIAIVYYHELVRYQERMDIMTKKNKIRQAFYATAVCLTIAVSVITAGVILSVIYHP